MELTFLSLLLPLPLLLLPLSSAGENGGGGKNATVREEVQGSTHFWHVGTVPNLPNVGQVKIYKFSALPVLTPDGRWFGIDASEKEYLGVSTDSRKASYFFALSADEFGRKCAGMGAGQVSCPGLRTLALASWRRGGASSGRCVHALWRGWEAAARSHCRVAEFKETDGVIQLSGDRFAYFSHREDRGSVDFSCTGDKFKTLNPGIYSLRLPRNCDAITPGGVIIVRSDNDDSGEYYSHPPIASLARLTNATEEELGRIEGKKGAVTFEQHEEDEEEEEKEEIVEEEEEKPEAASLQDGDFLLYGVLALASAAVLALAAAAATCCYCLCYRSKKMSASKNKKQENV